MGHAFRSRERSVESRRRAGRVRRMVRTYAAACISGSADRAGAFGPAVWGRSPDRAGRRSAESADCGFGQLLQPAEGAVGENGRPPVLFRDVPAKGRSAAAAGGALSGGNETVLGKQAIRFRDGFFRWRQGGGAFIVNGLRVGKVVLNGRAIATRRYGEGRSKIAGTDEFAGCRFPEKRARPMKALKSGLTDR